MKSLINPIHRALFAFCLTFICLHAARPSLATDEAEKVIILFDQSASMNDFDPKLVSKKWLMEFVGAFKKNYSVVLAGFDDRVHEHLRLTTSKEEDIARLSGKMDSIITSGLTTDLETPLRYLLEDNDKRPLSMAVIVSDGEPEIWDEKRPFLSKRVRTDKRYDDLNARYRALTSQGNDPRRVHNLLHAEYHARNIKLTEEQLAGIKDKLGKKLVFLDVSGTSEYFRSWAEKAGAEYIAISPKEDVSPVERLREALISLKQKTADIVEEPQPEGKQAVLEIPLEMEPEAGRKATAEKEKPRLMEEKQGEPLPEEESPSGMAMESPRTEAVPESMKEPAPLSVPVLETPIAVEPESAPAEHQNAKQEIDGEDRAAWWTVLLLILAAVMAFCLAVFLWRQKNVRGLEQLREKAGEAGETSARDTARYIDDEIVSAMEDADKLRSKLLVEERGKLHVDRRLALRIPVPPGVMEVRWTDKNGEVRSGPGLEISMNGVFFEAGGFYGDGIDAIVCPGLNLTFRVKRSDIRQREAGRAVAQVKEFEDNIEDRMKWIELLTRI